MKKAQDLKVLICDDSLLSRKNLRDGLRKIGCVSINETVDGQGAVDSYKKDRPDVVFLDIVMPVMDGITALKQIREYDPEASVIMISSMGTKSFVREAVNSGASDFLQKPATTEQIRTSLRNFLEEE